MKTAPTRLRELDAFRDAFAAEKADAGRGELSDLRARLLEEAAKAPPPSTATPRALRFAGGTAVVLVGAALLAPRLDSPVEPEAPVTEAAVAEVTVAEVAEPVAAPTLLVDPAVPSAVRRPEQTQVEPTEAESRAKARRTAKSERPTRRAKVPVPQAEPPDQSPPEAVTPEKIETVAVEAPIPTPAVSSLAAELEAYDQAKLALDERRWALAAERLRGYLGAFPSGRLRIEARLDLVEALVRGERPAEALEIAEQLLADRSARRHHAELRQLAVQLAVRQGECERAEVAADGASDLLELVQKCENGGG